MGTWKNLPLHSFHQELGAKMVPFATWSVPQQYPGGAQAEHRHTRSKCSLFDFSCTGAYQLSGPGCAETLDLLLVRKVSGLELHSWQENCLLSEKGGVIDLLKLCRMAEDDFFVVTSPGNIASDAACFTELLPPGIALRDLSDDLAHFSLQGPESAGVLREFGLAAETLPVCGHWTSIELDGIRCICCGCDWSGETGYELFFNADHAEALWDMLLEIAPLRPAGFGAHETLRIETGRPAFGSELSPQYTPIESGLEKMVTLHAIRGAFLGKAALLAASPGSCIAGVLLAGRNAAHAGAAIFDGSGKKIGVVTSGAFCPTLEQPAALCRFEACGAYPGDKVLLECGGAKEEGIVTELPFLKKNNTQGEK